MPAGLCSTGEQKALLIGLILAQARAVAGVSGIPPLLLLDEVAAHLDRERRQGLFGALAALGCQAWMTGTDVELFADLGREGMVFHVEDGTVSDVKRV
jgi:DNA replication and repair protein RecF